MEMKRMRGEGKEAKEGREKGGGSGEKKIKEEIRGRRWKKNSVCFCKMTVGKLAFKIKHI